MNVENNKMDYLIPKVVVVKIRVECGFAATENYDWEDQLPEIEDENEDIEW